mmetsp:Transcript_861/g.1929  ORF Transcript_861/g.1929 Transcript_861/m.1929 type:complete len:325 (+) Transcript_861:42-1016(+)
MTSGSLNQQVKAAQSHAAAGRAKDAKLAYQEACSVALKAGTEVDPYLFAAACLGYADICLQQSEWPSVLGKHLDDLLAESLAIARTLGQRNRTIEGQLVLLQSQALLAKPRKTATDIDSAMAARHEAITLLHEGAVESLPWSTLQLSSLVEEQARCTEALSTEELFALLRPLGDSAEVQSSFSLLFESWSISCGGVSKLSLSSFAQQFQEIAQRLERAVDKAPCAAPCEGGGLPEGSSKLEADLVALISKDGLGKWESKAAALQSMGHGDVTASSVQLLWKQLAPKVKKTVDADDTMACGHSCSTCPTRHDCQLHGVLKDIEDM